MNSPSLHLLLVDDEAPARKEMKTLLRAHPEVSVIGEAEDIDSAASQANAQRPDAIFLDIQLADASGFDLPPLLTYSPQIVFVTAYDQYALNAFDANAIDYLLKPVHPQRLKQTIQRLLQLPQPTPEASSSGHLILLRDRERMRLARAHDIVAIRAEGTYCHVELEDGENFYLHRSISQWEQQLPSGQFIRLDRSLLVNLSYIRGLHPIDRNSAQVEFTIARSPLIIGRTAVSNLRTALRAILPPQA